jgi:hypothetical protein
LLLLRPSRRSNAAGVVGDLVVSPRLFHPAPRWRPTLPGSSVAAGGARR